MFKRRRPEDPAEPAASPFGTAPAAQTGSAAVPPAQSRTEAGIGFPASQPAEVPSASPFPTSVQNPAASKEAPTMGRSPFPAPPSPPAPGSMPQGAPTGRPPMPGVAGAAPNAQSPGPKKDVAERRTLVVGRGISVQGVVQDAERLVVEGTVEATMIHATELSVAQGGVFRGEVEVEDAELAGTVDGTLTARGNLTIRATGRLIGTAKCRRLQVEDGGQVTGRLEMITEQTRSSPQPVGEPITSVKPAPVPLAAIEPAAVPV